MFCRKFQNSKPYHFQSLYAKLLSLNPYRGETARDSNQLVK